MNERLQKLGLTPGKAALVAVLAVAMGVVWGPQVVGLFGGSSVAASKRAKSAIKTPAERNASAQVGKHGTSIAKPKTLVLTLADAKTHDPFEVPAWSPFATNTVTSATSAPGAAERLSDDETRFQTIRQAGASMILHSGEGTAVQVGEKTLRVGDRIDGFEVVEITPQGVIFKPSPPTIEGDASGA